MEGVPAGAADKKLLVIGVASVFLIIVAVLLDLQYLYLMAAALGVLPLASYLLARYGRARFLVTREHEATTQEERLTPLTLRLTATGGLPLASLRVGDMLPAEMPLARSPAAGAEARAATEPLNGMPPADALAPTSPRSERTATPLLALDEWDGETGNRTYHVAPNRRGVYHFGPARLVTTDPLGLFTFVLPAPGTMTEIVVHPTPIPAVDTVYGGSGLQGLRESDGKTLRGDGMDFHGVREYRAGDALRRVHWPTTARTGALAVVEWERAYQRDLVIGLDAAQNTHHGKGRETTLEYAVKVAATLVDRTLTSGGGVLLVTQSGRVHIQPGDNDKSVGRFRLFDLLARVEANATTFLADALAAARPEAGSHFVILTARGDGRLSVYLSERMARSGDSAEVLFFEPSSFGGPRVMSPAIAGAPLSVITCEHSPWREGGRELAYLFQNRDNGARRRDGGGGGSADRA